MKRNYDTIPLAFEEAAQIDGASVWQSFVGLLLPLSVSALTMTLLFSFFVAWNEYVIGAIVYPKLFELQPAAQPAPYPAAALLISIPAILFFLLVSRLLIAAMHRGPVMD
jgi:ABC-type maltose transport system permease subunit